MQQSGFRSLEAVGRTPDDHEPQRGDPAQGNEAAKKWIALTTETQRHREKPLSFQSSVPLCLCGEKFVP
jgi:hypothetical protein